MDQIDSVLATQQAATKNDDDRERVHRLLLWTGAKDEEGRWMYKIGAQNDIQFTMLIPFVKKNLSEQAARLATDEQRTLRLWVEGRWCSFSVIFLEDVSCKIVFVVLDDVKPHYYSPWAALNKDGITRKEQGGDLTKSNQ